MGIKPMGMKDHSDDGLEKVDLKDIEPPKVVRQQVNFRQWLAYVWHALCNMRHQRFSISDPRADLYVLACRCGKVFASTPGYKDSAAWDHAKRMVLYPPEK